MKKENLQRRAGAIKRKAKKWRAHGAAGAKHQKCVAERRRLKSKRKYFIEAMKKGRNIMWSHSRWNAEWRQWTRRKCWRKKALMKALEMTWKRRSIGEEKHRAHNMKKNREKSINVHRAAASAARLRRQAKNVKEKRISKKRRRKLGGSIIVSKKISENLQWLMKK